MPESRLAQLEAVLSEIFPVLKDIKAAREWEGGTMRGEREVVASAAALKVALLMLDCWWCWWWFGKICGPGARRWAQ